MSPAEARAQALSPGWWGEWGSANLGPRYTLPRRPEDGPRGCHCGCGTPATHRGMSNGVCLTAGCEWSMRQWVRDPWWQQAAS